jgi:hypothetical protein
MQNPNLGMLSARYDELFELYKEFEWENLGNNFPSLPLPPPINLINTSIFHEVIEFNECKLHYKSIAKDCKSFLQSFHCASKVLTLLICIFHCPFA